MIESVREAMEAGLVECLTAAELPEQVVVIVEEKPGRRDIGGLISEAYHKAVEIVGEGEAAAVMAAFAVNAALAVATASA